MAAAYDVRLLARVHPRRGRDDCVREAAAERRDRRLAFDLERGVYISGRIVQFVIDDQLPLVV